MSLDTQGGAPRYSIVVTTHQRPVLLSRALLSVKAQAGAPQIVLVSDAPCPHTDRLALALLDGPDLYIQRRGEPGPATSRNVGMMAADGDFTIFLDDDDALSPRYLAEAAPHATAEAVLFTDFTSVFERLEPEGPVPVSGERRSLAGVAIADVHVKNFIPPACLIYPRAALLHRRVEPSLVLNEDWDFILNVCTGYPLRHLPIEGPVVFTREAPDNRGRRNDHLLVDTYRRIYKRWPAPTAAGKRARQDFFRSVQLEAALEDL